MARPARPLRADAARNRERVLDVAYKTFATQGLSVSMDEIAKRAEVGPGTVYRHFPTKEDLVRAVITDRLEHIIDEGNILLDSEDPGQALFEFMRSMVLNWGATNVGLKHALAGSGMRLRIKSGEKAFLALCDELLRTAQDAGTVRTDVTAAEIKALIVGCQAIQTYDSKLAPPTLDIVIDGLRPSSGKAGGRDGGGPPKGTARRRKTIPPT